MAKIAHAHKLIAETAKEFANELYDNVMSANDVRAAWKKSNLGASEKALRTRFVAKNWSKCLPAARTTLAAMLQSPIDETLKEQIMEALILDNTLLAGRANPASIAGVVGGN